MPKLEMQEKGNACPMDLFVGINSKGVKIVMMTHSHKLAGRAGRLSTMEKGAISENGPSG